MPHCNDCHKTEAINKKQVDPTEHGNNLYLHLLIHYLILMI